MRACDSRGKEMESIYLDQNLLPLLTRMLAMFGFRCRIAYKVNYQGVGGNRLLPYSEWIIDSRVI